MDVHFRATRIEEVSLKRDDVPSERVAGGAVSQLRVPELAEVLSGGLVDPCSPKGSSVERLKAAAHRSPEDVCLPGRIAGWGANQDRIAGDQAVAGYVECPPPDRRDTFLRRALPTVRPSTRQLPPERRPLFV